MLKIVIGTNEGKVLCISNNEDEIKASMVNYLIDTDQEPTEDFFESRNWGEYDIEVYEYHQPQLNENQKIKTNNNLLKINDLAFELQHGTVLTNEQWEKVEKIYKLSLMGDEEEE
ncbi:hypothetical protein [Enterococcus gallinarum]|uniref:hypothetical protein n=1 Tax=Enterococcus gallinarum TaxID=1353 RepID=UPI001F56928C|nr:hypothetical protein [Enterococcus gallinarum]